MGGLRAVAALGVASGSAKGSFVDDVKNDRLGFLSPSGTRGDGAAVPRLLRVGAMITASLVKDAQVARSFGVRE